MDVVEDVIANLQALVAGLTTSKFLGTGIRRWCHSLRDHGSRLSCVVPQHQFLIGELSAAVRYHSLRARRHDRFVRQTVAVDTRGSQDCLTLVPRARCPRLVCAVVLMSRLELVMVSILGSVI